MKIPFDFEKVAQACIIPECGKEIKSHNVCGTHYMGLYRATDKYSFFDQFWPCEVPVESLRSQGINVIPAHHVAGMRGVKWKPYETRQCDLPVNHSAAVICGPVSGGLVVFDVDKNIEKNRAIFDKFDTFTVAGRGLHYYFFMPDFPHKRFTGRAPIDVIGWGGVYAPGSVHEAGFRYEVKNDSPVRTVDSETMKAALEPVRDQLPTTLPWWGAPGSGRSFDPQIPSRLTHVRYANTPEGGRDEALFAALRELASRGISEEQISEYAAVLNGTFRPPLGRAQVEKTVNSVVSHWRRLWNEDSEILPLRRVTSQEYAGKFCRFRGMVFHVGPQRSVKFQAAYRCEKQHDAVIAYCNDEFQVKVPKCGTENCQAPMTELTDLVVAGDMCEVVVQELPADAGDRDPILLNTILLKDDARTARHNESKVFNAKVVLFKDRGIGYDPKLVIRSISPLPGSASPGPDAATLARWKSDPDLLGTMSRLFLPHLLLHSSLRISVMAGIAGCGGYGANPHLSHLIVGDPSMGKSRILQGVADSCHRAAYVDNNSSGVGLAAGMKKLPDGTSVTVPGVLPTSDYVCFDEIARAPKETRDHVMTAMSMGFVVNAKIGEHRKFDAAVTVFGATNGKEEFIRGTGDLMDDVDFDWAFLSRFPMIWLVMSDPKKTDAHREHEDSNPPGPPDPGLRQYFNYVAKFRSVLPAALRPEVRVRAKKLLDNVTKNRLFCDSRRHAVLGMLATAVAKLRLHPEVTAEDLDLAESVYADSLESLFRSGKFRLTSKASELRNILQPLAQDRAAFDARCAELGIGKLEAVEILADLRMVQGPQYGGGQVWDSGSRKPFGGVANDE